MILIGLTGGIATGKSTVAGIFRELGCRIIDADVIAREVVQPLKPAWKDIVAHFGNEILQENGELDREKLGNIIFCNEEKRKLLNKFTHPRIFKKMVFDILFAAFSGERVLILDLPLLFEKNYHKSWLVSKTIVISCNEAQQLERLMKRNNLDERKATDRINSQMPLKTKCKLADVIIDNSQEISNTRSQVKNIFDILNNSTIFRRNRLLLLILGSISIGTVFYILMLIFSILV